ncbi:MAG: hypothetical protein GC162_20355 [Planctomycetes bacterium]|nr:hypothetical protein [Planctomycetota bacterium]
MNRAPRSLQSRLVIGSMLSVSLVFLAASAALYWMVQARLYSQLDASLVDEAHAITSGFEIGPQGIDLELDNLRSPQFLSPDGGAYYQVFDKDGAVLARSPSLNGRDLIDQPKAIRAEGASATVYPRVFPYDRQLISDEAWVCTVVLPDGGKGRLVQVMVRPQTEDHDGQHVGISPKEVPTLTLALAHTTRLIDESLANLRMLLASIWLVTVVVLIGVLTMVVRAGLGPAKALSERIQEIDERALAEAIDLPGTPRELVPVVTRLNELLARLDAAFLRERTLLADVAHELRTPLAGLRSTLEVSLSQPREARSYRDDLRQCLTISAQMQTMVENLLAMARLEAGQTKLTIESVELDSLLDDCWRELGDTAEMRGLTMTRSGTAGVMMMTDASKLRVVLRNLLENAVTYADPNGSIKVAASQADGRTSLYMVNVGCEIEAMDSEHVFDRFWRVEASRSGGAAGHCGLGLPLCRQIVRLMGGTVNVRCERGGEFEVTAHVPDLSPDAMKPDRGDHP